MCPEQSKWLARLVLGAILSSLGGLATLGLVHERRISTIEAQQEDTRSQLDRIERKLDRMATRSQTMRTEVEDFRKTTDAQMQQLQGAINRLESRNSPTENRK